jgi:hypothetical protein
MSAHAGLAEIGDTETMQMVVLAMFDSDARDSEKAPSLRKIA